MIQRQKPHSRDVYYVEELVYRHMEEQHDITSEVRRTVLNDRSVAWISSRDMVGILRSGLLPLRIRR